MIFGETKLVCEHRAHRRAMPCQGVLGVLPGPWIKVRPLERGENSRPGYGSLACPVKGCRRKYEVVPDWEAMTQGEAA